MYIVVDCHKRYSNATKIDERGKVSERVRLSNDPQTLLNYVEGFPAGLEIALEAIGNWYYFYELLENKTPEVYLAHPLKTKVLPESRLKTCEIDSKILLRDRRFFRDEAN